MYVHVSSNLALGNTCETYMFVHTYLHVATQSSTVMFPITIMCASLQNLLNITIIISIIAIGHSPTAELVIAYTCMFVPKHLHTP